MNGARYRTPSIVSAHTAPYDEYNASAYAASSISSREKGRGQSVNGRSGSVRGGPPPLPIPPLPVSLYAQQQHIAQPQPVRIPTYHASQLSRPSKSWFRRSPSRNSNGRAASNGAAFAPHASSMHHSRSAPPPLAIPPNYQPASPGIDVSPRRGRTLGASFAQHHRDMTHRDPFESSNRIEGLNIAQHLDPSHNRADKYREPYQHSKRSASQHPSVSPNVRPTYDRKRSKSYDPAAFHPQEENDYANQPHSAGTYGGPSGGYRGAEFSPYMANYTTMQASSTSPTLVHPSAAHPLVVPVNDGRDGWVVVPGKGQSFRVLNQKGLPYEREHQSFFGRLNFRRFRSRSRNNKTFNSPVHVGNEGVQPIPVRTMANPPLGRGRRDSY